jgi:hypothetical protein
MSARCSGNAHPNTTASIRTVVCHQHRDESRDEHRHVESHEQDERTRSGAGRDGVEGADLQDRYRARQDEVAQHPAPDRADYADHERTHGSDSERERLRGADRAEDAHHDGIEPGDRPVGAGEQRLQDHAEDGGCGSHEQVPVRPDHDRRLVEYDVPHEAAAERHRETDHDDAEHIDATLTFAGRGQSTLKPAEARCDEFDPQRHLERLDGHGVSPSCDGTGPAGRSRTVSGCRRELPARRWRSRRKRHPTASRRARGCPRRW